MSNTFVKLCGSHAQCICIKVLLYFKITLCRSHVNHATQTSSHGSDACPRGVLTREREKFSEGFGWIVHLLLAILYIESALKPKFSWDSRWCKKLKWWIAYYTTVTLRVELVPQWKARRALAFCGKLIGIKSDRSMLTPLFMCNHVTLFKAFVEAIINSRCMK